MLNPVLRILYRFVNKWLFKFGYRFVEIPMVIKGVGHQIVEPCVIFKKQQLGLIPSKFKFIIFFSIDLTYSGFKIPHTNYALLKYLKKYSVSIVYEHSNSFFEKLKFKLLAPFFYPDLFGIKEKWNKCFMKYHVSYYMSLTDRSAGMFEINDLHRKPLFKIIKKDEAYGLKILKQVGAKENDWFVTFHFRDSVFYKDVNYWEANYSNRCVDVDSYYEACKEIIERGGWCFRIATKRSKPLPDKFKKLKKVIDILDIDGDIDRFSVFLLSKCKFFLGCNSGPALVPGFFGIPTVQVQTAPFYGLPIHHFDLYIFKKYYSLEKKRLLSLKEMLAEPYVHIRLDEEFEKNKIQLQNNTSEEVLDLVKEMLNRIEEKGNTNKYGNLFRQLALPNTYCYKVCSSMGNVFFNTFYKNDFKVLRSGSSRTLRAFLKQ